MLQEDTNNKAAIHNLQQDKDELRQRVADLQALVAQANR